MKTCELKFPLDSCWVLWKKMFLDKNQWPQPFTDSPVENPTLDETPELDVWQSSSKIKTQKLSLDEYRCLSFFHQILKTRVWRFWSTAHSHLWAKPRRSSPRFLAFVLETRNPKPTSPGPIETRNPKPETRNPKLTAKVGFKSRNPKPETRNWLLKLVSNCKTRNPRPETYSESGFQSMKPETRNPKPTAKVGFRSRNPKPETRNPKPTAKVGFKRRNAKPETRNRLESDFWVARTCRVFFVMKELSLQSRVLVVNSFPRSKPTPVETQTLLSRPQDPPYF